MTGGIQYPVGFSMAICHSGQPATPLTARWALYALYAGGGSSMNSYRFLDHRSVGLCVARVGVDCRCKRPDARDEHMRDGRKPQKRRSDALYALPQTVTVPQLELVAPFDAQLDSIYVFNYAAQSGDQDSLRAGPIEK